MAWTYERKRRPAPKGNEPLNQDWAALLNAIIRSRVSKCNIAKFCSMSEHKLNAMLAGTYEPTWSEGQAIIALNLWAIEQK